MRLLGAAIFVFVGICVCIALFSPFMESTPLWVGVPLFVIFFLGLLAAALMLFNLGRSPTANPREPVEELSRRGLTSTELIRARRVFRVEQFEDEGLHFFFELHDGRVLYLNGHYLDEVCDREDGNARFPNSEFKIIRHKTQGYVITIVSTGTVLPLDLSGAFNHKANGLTFPEDGEIVSDKGYDEFKREVSAVIDPIEAA